MLGYGAGADRPLTLPSESGKYASINGVISARELVSWYNGHPHYHSFLRDNNIHLRDISDIVIVGNGNVAIDIARILTKDVETLRSSDIPSDVLAELEGSGVSRVHIVGRRGHCQASFTIKEFREMTKLRKYSLTHSPTHHRRQFTNPNPSQSESGDRQSGAGHGVQRE